MSYTEEEWEEPTGVSSAEWSNYYVALDRFDYHYFKVLELDWCGPARTLYKVAHSGRHAAWREIAKEFRKRGFSRRGLEKLRRLGRDLDKAHKALRRMVEANRSEYYDSDVPF